MPICYSPKYILLAMVYLAGYGKLVVMLLAAGGYAQDTKAKVISVGEKQMTWNEAMQACKDQSGDWSLPDGNARQSELYALMLERSYTSVWLSLKREKYSDWKWINDQIHNFENVVPDPGNMCAGITAQSDLIRSMGCAKQNGFICQMPDGFPCPVRRYAYACVEVQNTVFIIGCHADNYYDARSHCVNLGGDLAILDQQSIIVNIKNSIIEKKLFNHCNWYFVGLRKEDWKLHEPANKSSPDTYHWGSGEPRFGSGDCCTLERREGEYYWEAAACNSLKRVICVKYGNTSGSSRVTTDRSTIEQRTGSSNKGLLAAVCVLAILLAVVGGLIVFYFSRRRRRDKRKSEPSQEKTNLIMEARNDNQQSDDDNLPAEFNGVTVVMFSNGITKQSQPLKGVGVYEKLTSFRKEGGRNVGTAIANAIATAFKATVGKEFDEKCVQIINVNGVDENGLLPRGIPTELLNKYAGRNLSDVAYLAGGYPPAKLHVLQNLTILRNVTVCVTPAKWKSTEMPSPEVIAIGDPNYPDQTMKSGLVDFLHTRSTSLISAGDIQFEENFSEIEESVASVVGIIAGILWLMKKQEIRFQGTGPKEISKTAAMKNLLITMLEPGRHEDVGFAKLKIETILAKVKEGNLAKMVKSACEERKCFKTNLKQRKSVPTNSEKRDLQASNEKLVVFKYVGPHVEAPSAEPVDANSEKAKSAREEFQQMLCSSKQFSIPYSKKLIDEQYVYYFRDDESSNTDWDLAKEAITSKDSKDTPTIIFLASNISFSQKQDDIYPKLRICKNKNIIITNARGLMGSETPLAFPGDSVITVRDANSNEYGSTLDFTVSTKAGSNWAAATHACAVAAKILLKAQAIGLETARYEMLRTTSVMRKVLIEMCSHPECHNVEEGYGELKPDEILNDTDKFEEMLLFHTDPETAPDKWLGKTIELEYDK